MSLVEEEVKQESQLNEFEEVKLEKSKDTIESQTFPQIECSNSNDISMTKKRIYEEIIKVMSNQNDKKDIEIQNLKKEVQS